jgi:hypothetical protein
MRRVYPKYKKAAVSGGSNVNLMTGNLKMLLINTGAYTYNDAHEFLTDVPSGARIAASPNLSGKTLSDLVRLRLRRPDICRGRGRRRSCGDPVRRHRHREGTSRLVAFQDEGLTGAPISPDGTNIKLVVNAAGFLRL